jgi:WD40 repeat protein
MTYICMLQLCMNSAKKDRKAVMADSPFTVNGPCVCLRNAIGGLKVWDEETGVLHRELEGPGSSVSVLATFLSADGQQARLVVGKGARLRVYDPEAGLVLRHIDGHTSHIAALAFIESSSAAPHHPGLVSTSWDGTAKVWDGETGEMLGDLEGHRTGLEVSVAVWKEHHGGHDRIATASRDGRVKVWDGEAFTLLHDITCDSPVGRVMAFKSAGGQYRLLVAPEGFGGLQVWDPEERRLLYDGINRGCPFGDWHLFESAGGRQLLAITGDGIRHPRHPGDEQRAFLDVWDLGEAPPRANPLRAAHHLG